jgi:hypothetical protein
MHTRTNIHTDTHTHTHTHTHTQRTCRWNAMYLTQSSELSGEASSARSNASAVCGASLRSASSSAARMRWPSQTAR